MGLISGPGWDQFLVCLETCLSHVGCHGEWNLRVLNHELLVGYFSVHLLMYFKEICFFSKFTGLPFSIIALTLIFSFSASQVFEDY